MKNAEAKSNDINAMISPEGERVALGKVPFSFIDYYVLVFYTQHSGSIFDLY